MAADSARLADERVLRVAGTRRHALRRFRRDPVALCSLMFVILVLLAVFPGATLAQYLLGHGPNELNRHATTFYGGQLAGFWSWIDPDAVYMPHRALYILGADGPAGRDALLRLLYGGRITLEVAFVATFLSVGVGMLVGGVAGYYGGRVGATLGWLTDLVMTFPFILFGVALWTTIGPSLRDITVFGTLPAGVPLLAIVIGAFTWFYPMRLTRIQVMSLREREFIAASRMLGAGELRILRSHILPYLAAPMLGYATIAMANAMIAEAGLAWLGLRVPIPEASWGGMIADANNGGNYSFTAMNSTFWMIWLPVIAVLLTVISLNLLGEGVRSALDPRGRR